MSDVINFEFEEKGFFSLDGLFAIILLLLVVGNLINIYQGRSEMVESTREKLEGKMISEKLAGAINTVYATGKPITLNIELLENILGSEYEVDYDNVSRNVLINISGRDIAKSDVITSRVVENLGGGFGQVRISWENSSSWKNSRILVESI